MSLASHKVQQPYLADQSLPRALFSMTWPMLFGVVALMSFQLVDSVFISMLGMEPLAALGFTLPMQQLLVGVQIGIGIASTALISRALGAGETSRATQLAGLVVLTGCCVSLLLCVVIGVWRVPLLTALGANAQLLPYTESYWWPWLTSAWLGAFLYFASSIARANGDTRLPGLMMVITSLVNMLLDPLFIFTFGWGLPGAAYATIVACLIGSAIMYSRILKRHWLDFTLSQWPIKQALAQIFNTSVPAMLSQLMPGLASLLATRLVAGFGGAAIAAWTLGSRLELFSIVIVLALTMALPPMVGRLLGSQQLTRVHSLVLTAVRFVIGLQVIIALVWIMSRSWLAPWLAPDLDSERYLMSYMLWVPVSYAALGVCMLMVSVCNALGLPMRAVWISILRLFVCYLPALWLGATLAGMSGLYIGVLLGNVAAGLMSWQCYQRGLSQLNHSVGLNKCIPEL
ncbi:MATE family efflux transporter [Oceanisphaera avium]|uniref:MATE family efflux transporter n=1 Tax=Oceanisphaera avium TaxID=1903694 RepID=A0A1Y0CVH7_9GAMM|nr:MATE family efflux transporter [Oceanisphaera avium]ART78885.1 MATE family efflux transporter [Oceanisphaera avium]